MLPRSFANLYRLTFKYSLNGNIQCKEIFLNFMNPVFIRVLVLYRSLHHSVNIYIGIVRNKYVFLYWPVPKVKRCLSIFRSWLALM
jgi:hypothetical protein